MNADTPEPTKDVQIAFGTISDSFRTEAVIKFVA